MTLLGVILVAGPLVLAAYAYIAYPLILWMAARVYKTEPDPAQDTLPIVSVVVPAYNEEKQIATTIEALLSQDYPAALTQIVVVSDASTDATDRIATRYASRGVELLRMSKRSGKTRAENIASRQLRGEIVVNTDAAIRLHPSAISALIARMGDPSVGVASGRDLSISPAIPTVNLTEAGYVGYEMRIRTLETRTGGIVGASGSLYAIRARLHRIPVREDLSRDFSAALTAREHGLRAVSVDEAICFVTRTSTLQREYRRKVRTITRGISTLYAHRALLNPIRYGGFAWKLFSHKVCRWLVPVSAVPGVIGLFLLARSNQWASLALAGVMAVGALSVAGALWPSGRTMPRLLSIAAFGVAANLAVIHAVFRTLAGRRDNVWEPTRRAG